MRQYRGERRSRLPLFSARRRPSTVPDPAVVTRRGLARTRACKLSASARHRALGLLWREHSRAEERCRARRPLHREVQEPWFTNESGMLAAQTFMTLCRSVRCTTGGASSARAFMSPENSLRFPLGSNA